MPPKRVRKPLDQDKAFSIAKAAARKLSARGCLSETDRKQVRQANEILLQIRQPYKRRTYQLFLSEVLHKCGSSLFLICAVALGQANIADMRNGERHSLLRELEAQKDLEIFDDEVIRSLASQHVISLQEYKARGIRRTAGATSVTTCQYAPGDGPDSRETATSPEVPEPDFVTTQSSIRTDRYLSPGQKEVVQYASVDGAAAVFNRRVRDAIRTVPVLRDGATSWQASVTMLFPIWAGLVDCLMSLDIHDWGIGYFTMALFNARVEWVGEMRHIVLEDGTILIIPGAEATLKGVKDEAILKVFGPEIFRAIEESPVRRKEIMEGKFATECVSMILTKNGAIISLSLGLDKGLEIQKKLSA